MATKEQFEFFRSLYEEEERRYGYLSARGTFYVGVVTLMLTALALKLDSANSLLSCIPGWLIFLEACLFALTLLAVVLCDWQ